MTIPVGPHDRLSRVHADQARAHRGQDGDASCVDVGVGGIDELHRSRGAAGLVDEVDGRIHGDDVVREIVRIVHGRALDLGQQHVRNVGSR